MTKDSTTPISVRKHEKICINEGNEEVLPSISFPTSKNKCGILKRQITWFDLKFPTIKVISLGALVFIVILLLHYILLQIYSDQIGKLLTGSPSDMSGTAPKAYVRDASTSKQLDCRRVMQNDVNYMKRMVKTRITYQDPSDLPMDCASIKARNYFPSRPNSKQEASFPLAQARIVYKDYRFLEMELAAGYAPQNWYCFAIDGKADKRGWAGKNMITSYMECLKLLTAASELQSKHWKYVSLLQNHDVTIKTNQEAVQILEWMNGANDVEMKEAPEGRVNTKLDWSFEALRMFRNASKYDDVFNGVIPRLLFAKGYLQASFSRRAVNYMLNDPDLVTELINREEKQGFGNDEIVLPTLNAADALALPGGYTHNCLERGEYTSTSLGSTIKLVLECGSKHMRHAICVWHGRSDPLVGTSATPLCQQIAAKFDFGAIDCWYEEMFHRSYLETHNPFTRLNAHSTNPCLRYVSKASGKSANGYCL
uniref:Uncharacterized protein n=1 Tax=Ditylenchus dipsaci TaxID=166011 RepID=A0A915EVZ2_9BILA